MDELRKQLQHYQDRRNTIETHDFLLTFYGGKEKGWVQVGCLNLNMTSLIDLELNKFFLVFKIAFEIDNEH